VRPSTERREVAATLEALRAELDGLTVRGLRTAGPKDLAKLAAMHEELQRIGASFLARRLGALLEKTRADDRGAARAMMQVQSTLRVFERVLTLDTVAAELSATLADG
jgi:hypothetical protein